MWMEGIFDPLGLHRLVTFATFIAFGCGFARSLLLVRQSSMSRERGLKNKRPGTSNRERNEEGRKEFPTHENEKLDAVSHTCAAREGKP